MIYYFLPGLAFSGSEDLSEYILKSNLDLKGSQGRGGAGEGGLEGRVRRERGRQGRTGTGRSEEGHGRRKRKRAPQRFMGEKWVMRCVNESRKGEWKGNSGKGKEMEGMEGKT